MIIDKKHIIVIVAVILAFLIGLFAGVKYLAPALTTNHTTSNTVENQPIYITGTNTVDTKLQYVKGETVYLPGEVKEVLVSLVSKETPGAVAAKLDGKFDIGKPEFIYQINGKVGKFNKTDDENFVFEKNMIDLKQTSTIKIEAEIPTIDLTRHNVITGGVMYSNGKTSPAMGYTGSVGKVGAYQLVGSKDSQYAGVGIKF